MNEQEKKNMEDRLVWKSGDIVTVNSQCWDCINNQGIDDCDAYGLKPDDYSLNYDICPAYSKKP